MTTLSLSLFATAISYSESDASGATKPFLVFEHTESPDGRYAVAWGLPKHPDIWTKVCEFEREHPAGLELNNEDAKQAWGVFDDVNAVAEDVENYIVDVRDGKIIHKLNYPRTELGGPISFREPDYWTAAGIRPSRDDLEVVWSHAGNLVLVNHTFRWDCVTFCALLIRNGKVSSSLDLNKKLGAAVRPFAAKSFPRRSGYSKNNLNVCFSDVKQLSETKFSAHVDAVLGKKWDDGGGSVVNFTVISSNEGTIIKATDIRVLREHHEIRD